MVKFSVIHRLKALFILALVVLLTNTAITYAHATQLMANQSYVYTSEQKTVVIFCLAALVNVLFVTYFYQLLQRYITKNQQAEQKIREQSAILEVVSDAILVSNIDSQIVFWSKGAEFLYGWESEDILGKDLTQLLYKPTSHQLKQALSTVINQGEWQGELHQLSKNGKEIIVASRWILVRDEVGQPKSILSVNTEITPKKTQQHNYCDRNASKV